MGERGDGEDVNMRLLSLECSSPLTSTQRLYLFSLRICPCVCVFMPFVQSISNTVCVCMCVYIYHMVPFSTAANAERDMLRKVKYSGTVRGRKRER